MSGIFAVGSESGCFCFTGVRPTNTLPNQSTDWEFKEQGDRSGRNLVSATPSLMTSTVSKACFCLNLEGLLSLLSKIPTFFSK